MTAVSLNPWSMSVTDPGGRGVTSAGRKSTGLTVYSELPTSVTDRSSLSNDRSTESEEYQFCVALDGDYLIAARAGGVNENAGFCRKCSVWET